MRSPFFLIFDTSSDLTFNTPSIFFNFSKCEFPILVIRPMLGLSNELKY